jgi:hypothetical protein
MGQAHPCDNEINIAHPIQARIVLSITQANTMRRITPILACLLMGCGKATKEPSASAPLVTEIKELRLEMETLKGEVRALKSNIEGSAVLVPVSSQVLTTLPSRPSEWAVRVENVEPYLDGSKLRIIILNRTALIKCGVTLRIGYNNQISGEAVAVDHQVLNDIPSASAVVEEVVLPAAPPITLKLLAVQVYDGSYKFSRLSPRN